MNRYIPISFIEIENKVMEIAKEHAKIIDLEIKEVCCRFNLNPQNLIINYLVDGSIEILIKARHFKIENEFYLKKEVTE